MAPQSKFCPRCKTDKLLEDYYKAKERKDGLRGWCKSCHSELNHKNMRKPEYKEVSRNRMLVATYGITSEDYNQMAEAQNFCCSLCGVHESKLPKGLFVDHNHTTGQVRGLLCNLCNSALGKVKENISTLEKMIDYIKSSGDPRSSRS